MVTRQLSDKGELGPLRDDLRRIASQLGDVARASVERVDWPTTGPGTYIAARVREVVRNIFRSEVTRPVERRLNEAGFADFLIYPNLFIQDQSFRDEIDAVAHDLVELHEAAGVLREATTARDKAFVEDVWK
ncbi:hypothetical protein BIU92_13995 [Curtobacterium sp. MCBA15_003]|nr:hypothetical protein BIU92_13995 [Curtobacterium sp. MCBA15_003]OII32564.1 hypothetical protein BIU94_04480 [Curtobacterium sp. MMLR14_006]